MFVYYFVLVAPGSLDDVERALSEVLEGLPEAADIAYRQGEELRARLGPGKGRIAKTVRMEVGTAKRLPAQLRVPLSWEATGTPGLFPRMEAELVLSQLGEGLTHIAFQGNYQPPLGPVGRALDRALLHRLAETAVKGFVDRLARALVERMASKASSTWSRA